MRRNKKHGAGYLFQKTGADGTPSGVYLARWVVGGKYFTRSTGTSNKREAEKRLAEYTADIVAGDSVQTLQNMVDKLGGERARYEAAQDAKPALALADAWNAFTGSIRRRKCAPITERIYSMRFAAFVAWTRNAAPDVLELRDVSEELAAAFMRSIRRKFSPKTFNDYRAILSQVWDTLEEEARTACNPWKKIAPLDRETNRRRELTVEELAAVVGPLQGEMRTLFAIGIYTGLRLGDCVRLDWGAVDLVRGFIQLKPQKTARHGTIVRIPIADGLRGVLLSTQPDKRRGPILPDLLAAYSKSSVYVCKRVQAAFRAAGINTSTKGDKGRAAVQVGFHSLRHTFVSLTANAGVPFAVVQSIVGHSNAAMTEHYFHVSDGALKDAAAALPDVTGTSPIQPDAPDPSGAGSLDLAAVAAAVGRMGEKDLSAVEGMIARQRAALAK